MNNSSLSSYGKFFKYLSNHAAQFMDSKGIQYEKFDLGNDFTVEEFLNKFGRGSTFPQVHYNNANIGGMKDTVRYLAEHKIV